MDSILPENPITAPVYTAISEAQDTHQLRYLHDVKIARLKGIDDDERAALKRAVWDRFGEITVSTPDTKPTW